MILGFTQKINNKPTHFVEKILKSLRQFDWSNTQISFRSYENQKDFKLSFYHQCEPKLHTIREDKNDRLKPGTMIDFFINVRKKNMFRFAPRVPVVSVQKILISYELEPYFNEIRPTVWIDGLLKFDKLKRFDNGMLELAQNDGFDTVEDFFAYFNKEFKGKIIHWTDLKY